MQISTSNVLASQQTARAQRPVPQPADFQPIAFRKTTTTEDQAATEPAAPASYVRPGTYVDIKI